MLSDSEGNNCGIAYFKGLNPCSNGICSLTMSVMLDGFMNHKVLILVLMEYAL